MAGCVSGGAVAEAGGAATVSGGLVRSPRCSFSLCFFRFASFLLFSGWFFLSSRSSSLFFFRSSLFLLSPSFYLLLSLSSVFSFFLPVSPLFFLFSFPSLFSPFSPLPSSAFLASIYRGQGCCFLQLSWGSSRLGGHWRDCQGSTPLPGFLAGARWVVGHCVRSVGSRREREKIQIKASIFPSSPLRDRGEEER